MRYKSKKKYNKYKIRNISIKYTIVTIDTISISKNQVCCGALDRFVTLAYVVPVVSGYFGSISFSDEIKRNMSVIRVTKNGT